LAAPYVPQSVYPKEFDTNRTLYKVSNFGETVLSQDLQAWATTIFVEPVSRNEIWSENGFVTIEGELIYYNSVNFDSTTGKVNQLKDCIRNLNNSGPRLYKANTAARQFVVAQHHNALARAIVNIQNFIGYQNDPQKNTLDNKIEKLNDLVSLGDDCECPQANFYYTIASADAVNGNTINYNLTIYGNYNSFQIDFGDGSVTNTATLGSHTYAPNLNIRPIARIFSTKCDCAQTTAKTDNFTGVAGDDIQIYVTPTTTTGGGGTGGTGGGGGTGTGGTGGTGGGGGTGGTGGGGGTGGTGGDGTGSDTGTGGTGGGGTGLDGILTYGGETLTDQDLRDGTVIPTLPDFPELDLNDIGIPPRDLQLPAIVFPALDAKFGPIKVPSTIEIIGKTDIPSFIKINAPDSLPSFIKFGPLPNIPSFISIIQIDPIPSFIEISATEIQLLNSAYCVNCTEKIEANNITKAVVQKATDDGCRPCEYIDDNAIKDGNEIERIQVVVHDFFVTDANDEGSNRWDAVKILLRDPLGNTCLIMGSGPAKYDPATIPEYPMEEPITIIFDDNGNGSIYKYDRKLAGGVYKTSANGNWLKSDDGLADLIPPAPTPPYGSNLSNFTDRKLPAGVWRAYVVVGDGPATNCTNCKWGTRIIGMTNSWPNPSYLYQWALLNDCGTDCNCPEPTAYPLAGMTATTNCQGNVPPPDYIIPTTKVSIEKICIRVFYSEQNPPCPDPTPTPTPTATQKKSFSFVEPMPTPSFTKQPEIPEIPKTMTKRQLFESQTFLAGSGPVDFNLEINLPFNVIELDVIPTNLHLDAQDVKIKNDYELNYEDKLGKNQALIIPKQQSINIDLNNLFGDK
jgi:hypothetical protein